MAKQNPVLLILTLVPIQRVLIRMSEVRHALLAHIGRRLVDRVWWRRR